MRLAASGSSMQIAMSRAFAGAGGAQHVEPRAVAVIDA